MARTIKICPKCGGKRFGVSAHVVQDWEVDENGEFVKVVEDCIEVAHFPDDEDIWDCLECGYSSSGDSFNVTVED